MTELGKIESSQKMACPNCRQILNDLDINSLANENIICCPECGQQIKLPDEIVKKIRQSKFIGQNLDITC